jgi:hypothetical protein
MSLVARTVVESATCDACGAAIPVDPQVGAHHGVLHGEFGYGSPLDHGGFKSQCVLCETCWRKVCAALGIDPVTLVQMKPVPVLCAGCGLPIPPDHARLGHADGRQWHGACAPPPLPE